MLKGIFIASILLLSLPILVSCANSVQIKTVEKEDKLKHQARIVQVEKEKMELELRNSILTRALLEKNNQVKKLPKGQVVQPFPQFSELIYDQAKHAFENKDEERLSEAVRIMKSNQPDSKYLEPMYFWLAQLYQEKTKYNKALIIYNDFLRTYPASNYAPQALYLKGVLYEKLNLKDQALKIYKEVQQKYPDSRETYFSKSQIEGLLRK